MVAIKLPTVFHQAPPVLGAGARYVQVQLVHGDSVSNCHVVDPFVGGLASQQLPEHNTITGGEQSGIRKNIFYSLPPDIRAFAELGCLYDLGRHPGVSSSSRDLCGVVHLAGETKVGDFERFEKKWVFFLDPFRYEN